MRYRVCCFCFFLQQYADLYTARTDAMKCFVFAQRFHLKVFHHVMYCFDMITDVMWAAPVDTCNQDQCPVKACKMFPLSVLEMVIHPFFRF